MGPVLDNLDYSLLADYPIIPSEQQIPSVSDVEDSTHTDIIPECVSSRSGFRDDDPGTLDTGGGGYQDEDPGTSKTSEGGCQEDNPGTFKTGGGGYRDNPGTSKRSEGGRQDDPETSKYGGGGHRRDDPVTSKPCGGGHRGDHPATSKPCGGGHRGDDPVTSRFYRDGQQGNDPVNSNCNKLQEDDLVMLKSSVLENRSSSSSDWLSSSFQQDTTENFPQLDNADNQTDSSINKNFSWKIVKNLLV